MLDRKGSVCMKKIGRTLFFIMTIVLIVPIGFTYLMPDESGMATSELKQLVDRFNPLVAEQDVYVKTANQYGTQQEPGGYLYTQTGINEEEEEVTLSFFAGHQLREDAYLKLATKGKYVSEWEEVAASEIPSAIKDKLDE